MPSVIARVKRLYRDHVPEPVRHSKAVRWVKGFLPYRWFPHDALYDHTYYERTVEGPAAASAATMADSIVASFAPGSAIDIGCGTGALLAALRDRGCRVFGLEYSEAGLAYCRSRHLDVRQFDIESDSFGDGRSFDIAISMEVAEHLPERVADRYVGLIALSAPTVMFTAAPPGQGGSDHVNEKPREYWIEKFRATGFSYDAATSSELADRWRSSGRVASWYVDNLMVFRRAPATNAG